MPTSGTDLKVERVKARLKLKEVAARMGLSRQALWALELAEIVDPERAQQYLAALDRGREDTTTGKEPEAVA